MTLHEIIISLGIAIIVLSVFMMGVLIDAKRKPRTIKGTNIDFEPKKTIMLSAVFLGVFLIGVIMTLEAYLLKSEQTIPVASHVLTYVSAIILVGGIETYFTLGWLERKKVVTDEKRITQMHLGQIILVFVSFLGLIFMLQGIVEILTFPLNQYIVHFSGKLGVKYYAICILVGAIVAYVVARKKFMKLGYAGNTLENLFYVALPAGIVGARLWYVIAEWNTGGFSQDFSKVFDMLDGGMAIQGGVLMGAAVGLWFMRKTKKEINLLMAIDLIVPGILLAQAIGRWGNFFNAEVYGAEVARTSWSFLPDIILNQMQVAGVPENIYVPLFLVEATLNVIGYFVLVYAIGRPLKKYLALGDLGCGYLIWYGTVRAILEPLRDSAYKMGDKSLISQNLSFIFIACGIIGIIVLHYLKAKKPKLFITNTPIEQKLKLEEGANNE